MNISSIVKNSADIINVVHLQKNDIYKRVRTQYSGSDPELRFGIVTDVLNNGETCAITAIEIVAKYDVTTEMVLLTDKQSEGLFPATLVEVQEYFTRAREMSAAKIKSKNSELAKLCQAHDLLCRVLDTEQLTEANTKIQLTADPVLIESDKE